MPLSHSPVLHHIPVLTKTTDPRSSPKILKSVSRLVSDIRYFRVVVAPNDPILENVNTQATVGVPAHRPHPRQSGQHHHPHPRGHSLRDGHAEDRQRRSGQSAFPQSRCLALYFPHEGRRYPGRHKLRKALKGYTDAYGQYGFIDFTAEPEFDINDDTKRINLTLKFYRKQYYVRRIDFSGNTTTRDKVIRRELLLDEGQLFNKRAWEISILRLNQLDYFDRIEEDKAVEIKQNTKEGTVDLNLKLKEKGKQSIGLQGGVSGLAGTFIGLTYQTNNFLGLGERLTFSAQFGDIQRSFMFGFTEPYLFDRPISTGFTIFSSRYSFNQARQEALLLGQSVSINPQFVQNYNQDSDGFTLVASYPMKRLSFARVGLTYGLTRTTITPFNDASKFLFEDIQFRSVAGPSALTGIVSSTITPILTFNTVDNPTIPRRAKATFIRSGSLAVPWAATSTPSPTFSVLAIPSHPEDATSSAFSLRAIPLVLAARKFRPSAATTWAAKATFAATTFARFLRSPSFRRRRPPIAFTIRRVE